MNEHLTLQDIADRTRIHPERLRYVFDQKLLPGLRRGVGERLGSRGRGVPRSLTAFEAFSVACAALLLGAGLRRQTVMDCMDVLCAYSVPGSRDWADIPLYQAFEERDMSVLEIGDGANVRLVGSSNDRRKPLDFPWRQIGTGAEVREYEPLVLLTINTAKLRRCFA